MNLKTTGAGRVRFNPNLYNCGKVCLSLLGTWQGGKGEGWDPHASTMVQVLISIQSLILVPEPYFNEPGYERSMNTPEGDARSRQYNLQVQQNNIRYAMLDNLKAAQRHFPEFEEVIRGHLRLRKVRCCVTGSLRELWLLAAKAFCSLALSKRAVLSCV